MATHANADVAACLNRMEKKMEQARILLRHSPLSIKEIAERLGFSSQYHLSGYFKSRTGVSPRRFRQTI